jgi:hypothetical protein
VAKPVGQGVEDRVGQRLPGQARDDRPGQREPAFGQQPASAAGEQDDVERGAQDEADESRDGHRPRLGAGRPAGFVVRDLGLAGGSQRQPS